MFSDISAMIAAAHTLAHITVDLLSNPEVLTTATAELAERRGGDNFY
ncbi:MAG: hypothetical protein VX733_08090 [Candidatus Latescibacterota bacterium]|nr:hypothetical protein [Candidatus Latescibacterota bacterium]